MSLEKKTLEMACNATLKSLGCFNVVDFVYLPEVNGRDFEKKKIIR